LFNRFIGGFVKSCFLSVRRSLAVAAVLATCATLCVPTDAANSGLDTPTGVTELPFGIEGTEIMDLTPSGLTITTTAASTALNVTAGTGTNRVGYFQAANTDYVIPLSILNNSVTCANGGAWGFGINGSSPNAFNAMPAGSFWIHEDCYGARLTITANGYVGIGTTSPGGNLDIENGANTAKLCLNGACTESLASGEPQIVEAAVGGTGNATAIATCPVGTYVTGGGALCTNGGGGGSDAWVFESYPSSSTTWTARCDAKVPTGGGGFNNEPVAANAYAICK
jgi:hypothetical protein